MKTLLLLTIAALLSACGGAPGSSASPVADSPTGSNPVGGGSGGSGGAAPTTHNCEMDVTGNDPDFTFAPAIIGTNANENNPGPQAINFGQTRTYTLVDTSCDFQITGVSASNGAFTVSVVVKVDGTQVAQWQIAVGISEEYRFN